MAPSRNGTICAVKRRKDATGAPRPICSANRCSAIFWLRASTNSDCPGPTSAPRQCDRERRGVNTRRAFSAGGACLQRAWECAAVEQDVLAGDEAGLGAAQESAGQAAFLRLAEAAGGIEFGPFREHRFHGGAALFRFCLGNSAA